MAVPQLYTLLILVTIFLTSAASLKMNKTKLEKPKKVTLDIQNGKHKLFVDRTPFYINGAGLEFGDIAALAKHGGNSFRTWSTENGQQTAKEVLDEAYKNGLMVTMGIEVGRERHGFDYNDETAVNTQYERIKRQVIALKEHPSLMIWAIGNELNLSYTDPRVWDAVNEISKMIHQVDPNHLTTTTLAGITQREIQLIKDRASDLDILSIQMYGELSSLPHLVRDYGWEGPYMVTEWGATGHWEVPTTSWGAPIEENSTIKAKNYLERFEAGIAVDKTQCLGSYVFLWGQKQERTPTWYGVFLEDGKETESVDVMHYIWTGKWPENRSPQIHSLTLDQKIADENIILTANTAYAAYVSASDLDGDYLTYHWEILNKSTDLKDGGDLESKPSAIEVKVIKKNNQSLEFISPAKSGNYRIFVYVYDGQNHAATANIPFQVK